MAGRIRGAGRGGGLMSPPERQRPPARGASANNNLDAHDDNPRSRHFVASEARRIACGVVAVDRAVACFERRCDCDCDCDKQLEAIIQRHSGGEAA